ncbi:UDP-N-acetylmuramate dehydrogenase [Kineosporia sp. A_224]|uniref:UDP-N-acetylmuramate dehydrogenase n=1 Tax=Kineosporia sp. A_224 TaxID=1962180 RepID=UPI000B4ACAB4|nr:UDP-N-acetylmuramate dehydrogenase [Kineosporia sp. A_224]
MTETSAATSSPGVPGQALALADLTTLRVGGPARTLLHATATDALIEAVSSCDAAGEPVLVLGGGSNLLVGDDGFDGTVVRVGTRGVDVDAADSCGGVSLRVAAGEPWDDLVGLTVARGWAGVEALSGIPGSTGATPLQNVGAYGQDVAETVATVRTWDRQDRRVVTMANADLEFGYRTSRLKEERFRGGPRYVVLEVTFQLAVADLSGPVRYAELARTLGVEPGGRAPTAAVREAVLGLRRGKGMVLDAADHDTWSAGSFFTNPVLDAAGAAALPEGAPRWPMPDGRVKTSAAWLIEHAGFARGHGLPGPASLSTKHTLALTNRGTARAADVLALAREVRDGVRTAFGVTLVPEPVLVGCVL